MKTSNYEPNEKCTARVAGNIIHRSADTGKRYLHKLRVAKGYNPHTFVSVGEFCEYYNLMLVI